MTAGAGGRGARQGGPAPRTFGQTVSEAWGLYRNSFRGLTAFYVVAFMSLALLFTVTAVIFGAVGMGTLAIQISTSLGNIVLGGVVGSLAAAVASAMAAGSLAQREGTPAAAIRSLRPVRTDLLAAALASSMVTLALVFLLAGSGLLNLLTFVITPLLFGPPVLAQVIAIEHRTLGAAWRRSRELLAGNAPRVLLYLVNVALGIGLLQLIFLGLSVSVASGVGGMAGTVAFFTVQSVGASLTYPFLALTCVVVYLDIRASHESFELADLTPAPAA